MNKTTFRVGCELNYQVSGPSAFIFNVGVVTNSFQRVLNEQFIDRPGLSGRGVSFPARGKKASPLFRCARVRFGSPIRRRLN